jgi:Ca2+-binding RTX toxin-like protein
MRCGTVLGVWRRRWLLLATMGALILIPLGRRPASAELLTPTCFGEDPTIVGTPGDDFIEGTPGDDVIVGLGGDDIIFGRGGDDLICGGRGDDLLYGNRGDDRLHGQGGRDRLRGGPGADQLDGGRGRDRVHGGVGWDTCIGGAGIDTATAACESWESIEWGPPVFWPLRAELLVGCAYLSPGSVCDGHHPGWAVDAGDGGGHEANGDPVHAAGSGRVIEVATTGSCTGWGNGKFVRIEHGGGTLSVYLHLSEVFVQPGDRVTPDTLLGRIGNTGAVRPCDYHHLHFEVQDASRTAIDPGPLRACREGEPVVYPRDLLADEETYGGSTWRGLPGHTWYARSDGPFCAPGGVG